MKGERIASKAVRKASNASKRKGKWANLPEIKAKLESPVISLSSVLSKLVKDKDIEKKKGYALWRPNDGGGGGGIASKSSSRTNSRSSSDTNEIVRTATTGAVATSVISSIFGARR
jgi:ribonuclease HII